jgi:hypothetical protein
MGLSNHISSVGKVGAALRRFNRAVIACTKSLSYITTLNNRCFIIKKRVDGSRYEKLDLRKEMAIWFCVAVVN